MTGPRFLSIDALRTESFIRHVEVHDSLDSTNNRAAELACDTQIELPVLVVARLQTAGRGRGTNKWWSADGALTFSLLIEPAAHGIATSNWPQLSLTTAVAICDAVEAGSTTSASSTIKWPNDVLVDGRKIAGILLESPGGASPAKDRLIIGIGLNVNNSCRHAPPDAVPGSIALCDVVDRKCDLQGLLIVLLNAIAVRLDQLRSTNPHLAISWQGLNHLTGQNVVVENGGTSVAGRCVEIASDGSLVVDCGDRRRHFHSGSVRIL